MKKFLNILFVGVIGMTCCGCNKYFTSEVTSGVNDKDIYYGAYNRRDMTWADAVFYQKGSSKRCEGVIHLNAPTRTITMKNDRVDAVMKAACTDGTIMNITWQLKKNSFADGYANGFDQYNKTYSFRTVSKGEFKKVADNPKVQIPNKEFLLKY